MCERQLNENCLEDSKESTDDHSNSETAMNYDENGAEVSNDQNLLEDFIDADEQYFSDDDSLFQTSHDYENQGSIYMVQTRLFMIEDIIKRKFVCYVCLLYILMVNIRNLGIMCSNY